MFQLSIPTWGSVNNFWSFPGTLVGYVRLKDAADLYNFYGIFIAIVFKKHKALYSIKKCFLCKMEHVHWRRSSNKKKIFTVVSQWKLKGNKQIYIDISLDMMLMFPYPHIKITYFNYVDEMIMFLRGWYMKDWSEAYLKPNRTSTMDLFGKISCKLLCRCLTSF